jgi:NAD(P)-dependent dehydrogenase (short-subunit alcohol dehydrogenase family)
MTLTDRRVLITGGSKGIGRAVASMLAGSGWQVVLVARGEQLLEQVCHELPGRGHVAISLDVGDEAAWDSHSEQLSEIHAIVCAAALLGPIGPIGSYAPVAFRRTLEVNVLGTLLAIRACLPQLRANRGAIVTFSGGGATAPLPRFDAYAASKAAVVRLSENLAVELSGDGVRVNCIAPGFVATDIHQGTLAAGPELAGPDYFARTSAELAQGGVPASEAAALVRLLLEDAGPGFTGKLISAQWDPWRDASFRERLAGDPALGTLRRIDDMCFGEIPKKPEPSPVDPVAEGEDAWPELAATLNELRAALRRVPDLVDEVVGLRSGDESIEASHVTNSRSAVALAELCALADMIVRLGQRHAAAVARIDGAFALLLDESPSDVTALGELRDAIGSLSLPERTLTSGIRALYDTLHRDEPSGRLSSPLRDIRAGLDAFIQGSVAVEGWKAQLKQMSLPVT